MQFVSKNEDQASTITTDKLKRFNEIQGTIAGTAEEEIAAVEEAAIEEGGNEAVELAEEIKDEVGALDK